MDQNKIINDLIKENELLKKRVELCSRWMKKEVEACVHKIAKRKITKMAENWKEDFFRENQEQIITSRIQDYFWDILLLNAPKSTLEHLVYSEINYFSLQKNTNLDWFNVISSYSKILDSFIEHFITLNYRKFAIKRWQVNLRVNDPLEKALHFVITKKYIISIWRVYWLIKAIKNNDKLYDYWNTFLLYLDKYIDLKNLLLDDNFFKLFTEIINSDVFWSKRHSGKISFEETKAIRKIIVWDFEDKNSILYILLESQSILY